MKTTIKFEFAAQIHVSHTVNRSENEIWFVLHGYGQLAKFFLNKFQPLFNEKRLIIAPEAINHYYLQGFSGRVGANWMTSHERENAIANNIIYLNTILDLYLRKFKEMPKIKVLGFSQGAATASRWVSQLSFPVDTLVLWGGGFAHDLHFEQVHHKLQSSEILVVTGNSDEFITPESMEKQNELISSWELEVIRLTYEGGHELDLPLLGEIFDGRKY